MLVVAALGWQSRTAFDELPEPSRLGGRYYGLAFGMSRAQAEASFEAHGAGRLREAIDRRGRPLLLWERERPDEGLPRSARFEFKDDQLIAVRARVEGSDPWARGPAVEATPFVVTARRARPDGAVDLRVLARGCAPREPEIAALLTQAEALARASAASRGDR
jgi:hypothetical protein